MNNFFNKYKHLFLDENNKNFDNLISSIKYFENKIEETYSTKNAIFHSDAVRAQFVNQIPNFGKSSKIVFNELIPAFNDIKRWGHPNTLHNITAPSLVDGIAAKTITSLYNPNCIWDFVSGNFIPLEESVSSQVANLVGFEKDSLGTFTFGGKATLLYAIRLGLNRCARETIINGVDKDAVVVTSSSNHYSIEYVCSLLGLGKKSCIRIPVDNIGLIDLNAFQTTMEKLIESKKKIACVILSGGNSLNNIIEPFEKIKSILNYLEKKYNLPYKPFLHADSVIGWLWLVYKDYDFQTNSLNITNIVLERIKKATEMISTIQIVDSVGVDFHKNAFASYISSLYLCKHGDELYSLNSPELISKQKNTYGKNFMQHYTLEHSRSGDGIISAYVSLQEMGVDGFRRYIASMMTLNEYIRKHIDLSKFEIINPEGLGFAIVLFPKLISVSIPYKQLITKDDFDSIGLQNYCSTLFDYICSKYGKDIPVIGYISNYSKSIHGDDIPAFKIYPISPNTSEKTLHNFLENLSALKDTFDTEWKHDNSSGDYPGSILFPK